MSIEPIAPELVRQSLDRIEAARRHATESAAPGGEEAPAAYWEEIFERNAAAVLRNFPEVRLRDGHAVRYLFYGRERADLLVRPLVTRAGLELTSVRPHIDWHPAPDSTPPADLRPTQDVELLYQYFEFEPTASGYFTYWIVLQEIWASARWIHSRLLADRADFEKVTTGGEWRICIAAEAYEPCAVLDAAGGCDLVALSHRWIGSNTVDLQRVRINADRSIRFLEPVGVAIGPRGYLQ